MVEYRIGATELRQKLTDIIQTVREGNATYVVETFGRAQVAIIDVEAYERFQEYWAARESFFRRLLEEGAANAQRNTDLSEEQLLVIIDAARTDVYNEQH
jgi:prevent-host-death family protein